VDVGCGELRDPAQPSVVLYAPGYPWQSGSGFDERSRYKQPRLATKFRTAVRLPKALCNRVADSHITTSFSRLDYFPVNRET
jgi:hypothetical protein